jgi:hypothetical protein
MLVFMRGIEIMLFTLCNITSLTRRPPNKKIGGLAVCQAVRIHLAGP